MWAAWRFIGLYVPAVCRPIETRAAGVYAAALIPACVRYCTGSHETRRGRSSAIVSGIPATVPAILKSPTSTPDRRVALYFSQGVFSENFLPRFSGRNSQRKIRLEGWGVQNPVQYVEIFGHSVARLSIRKLFTVPP